MADNPWNWSEPHKDHYRVTYGPNGELVYHWYKQEQAANEQAAKEQAESSNDDSGLGSSPLRSPKSPTSLSSSLPTVYAQNHAHTASTAGYSASTPAYSPAHSQNPTYWTAASNPQSNAYSSAYRQTGSGYASSTGNPIAYPTSNNGALSIGTIHPSAHSALPATSTATYSPPNSLLQTPHEGKILEFINGTPHRGASEPLDSSYFMRSKSQAPRFFRIGRVFALLFSETMGETTPKTDNDNVSTTIYQEKVYSQIRRFVVVEEKQGFCYGCPIFTYGKRGTLKPGCRPSEHAVIYNVGLQYPTLLQGEKDITKNPIAVNPVPSEKAMHPAARIQFGKVYPIEWNVKVKELGIVTDEDLANLIAYYDNERNSQR